MIDQAVVGVNKKQKRKKKKNKTMSRSEVLQLLTQGWQNLWESHDILHL